MTAAGTANNQAAGNTYTDIVTVLDFVISQRLEKVRTSMVVLVKAVTPGANGAPAKVDVQPMVNTLDGAGIAYAHGIVRGIPCFRYQGGTCAVMVDPQVGDIGEIQISHRDISSAIATRAVANPCSYRRFNYADSVYMGAILGPEPTDFVQVTPGAITVTTTGTMTLNAATLVINANVQTTGTVTNNGHAIDSTHKHVNSGGSGLGGEPE